MHGALTIPGPGKLGPLESHKDCSILSVQMQTLPHGKVKSFVQGHRAGKWHSWDLNPGRVRPESGPPRCWAEDGCEPCSSISWLPMLSFSGGGLTEGPASSAMSSGSHYSSDALTHPRTLKTLFILLCRTRQPANHSPPILSPESHICEAGKASIIIIPD